MHECCGYEMFVHTPDKSTLPDMEEWFFGKEQFVSGKLVCQWYVP